MWLPLMFHAVTPAYLYSITWGDHSHENRSWFCVASDEETPVLQQNRIRVMLWPAVRRCNSRFHICFGMGSSALESIFSLFHFSGRHPEFHVVWPNPATKLFSPHHLHNLPSTLYVVLEMSLLDLRSPLAKATSLAWAHATHDQWRPLLHTPRNI